MIEILEGLSQQIPFSNLTKDQFVLVANSMQIAYYPQDIILIDSQKMVDILFLIIKGSVKAINDEELIDIYHSNDIFGGIELIENRVSDYKYIVSEELICFEMPKEKFLELCTLNSDFKSYFFTSIAQRIDMIKEKREFSVMSDLMVAKVDSSIYHEACIVPSNISIIDALEKMQSLNASCVIVENSDGYGIVTDTDYRDYILSREKQNLETIDQIQTKPIIAATDGELLFNILLLMTEKSIKHLLIVDDAGKVAGILELIDLLSFFSNQSHLIVVQMQKANTLEDVIKAGKRVHTMIAALHSKGVKSRYIAKLVSEINRKMYTKLFEMVFPASWQEKAALVLLGSEGRAEQILHTDQDNALIFEDSFVPEDLEKYTLEFIEILDLIGFPRCEGNVMIINEKWCKSSAEYKKDIDHWIEQPSYEGLMDMAIFFDSSAVAGETQLHSELKEYLISKASSNKMILTHFARSIESFESPLGIFSQFVSFNKEHKDEIDIKKSALFALIHGIRALALEYKIETTNTNLRIKELSNAGFMNRADATNLMEALEVINTLRLHSQLEKIADEKPLDNYISTVTLSKIERDLLKDALKEVNHFKKLVSYHFHLSKVS
jgi:CBS domain-containing protein